MYKFCSNCGSVFPESHVLYDSDFCECGAFLEKVEGNLDAEVHEVHEMKKSVTLFDFSGYDESLKNNDLNANESINESDINIYKGGR